MANLLIHYSVVWAYLYVGRFYRRRPAMNRSDDRLLLRVRSLAALAVSCIGLLALLPQVSSAKTVWGTTSAEMATEPGFEGYWHYTLEISWDTTEIGGHGMSFLGFFLNLGVCNCACYPGVVRFDDVPGIGVGQDGCELGFIGLYECRGDPHYPDAGAEVKFEHDGGGCEPDWRGSAVLDFYSIFEPGEDQVHLESVGIKAGTQTAVGAIVGVLPLCQCGSPTDFSSWGTVKALYR
jgi:hypothetical protein